MSQKILRLNIEGFTVEVESFSACDEAILNLSQDFSTYVCDAVEVLNLNIRIFDTPINTAEFGQFNFKKIFRRCQTAQLKSVRLNKYDEKTFVKFCYKNQYAEVYAPDPADQRELCYLMILSRLGKDFDKRGLHRIHAFAGSYKDKGFALSMDMGHGKSTMAYEFLHYDSAKLMSDDAPYFDERGRLCPFHLRIGVSHEPHLKELERQQKKTYLMKRRNYPDKWLLPLSQLDPTKIETTRYEDFILLFGKRNQNTDQVHIKECSRLSAFIFLVRPMVIGIGLPILAEYFWEFGPRDFFLKSRIALLRFKRAAWLALTKKCYWCEFGESLECNVKAIQDVLES